MKDSPTSTEQLGKIDRNILRILQKDGRISYTDLAREVGLSVTPCIERVKRLEKNGYIESFNGKFRDEHLNESWFETLQQARNAASIWKQDYNQVRPHSSVGRIPPAEFAHLHRQRAANEGESINSNLD